MARYTTGELAELCDVTVRTVQFYDSKGLLKPATSLKVDAGSTAMPIFSACAHKAIAACLSNGLAG